jgi:RNA polymerase sigma-70 factor (ECF subfamily)
MAQEEISIRDLLHLCLSLDGQDGEVQWREFVRRTQPLIASVIINTVRRWKTPPPSLVDDLVQETYVKLFANDKTALRATRNEYENTIFGYLRVIASNVVRDQIELSDAVVPPGPRDRERLEFLHKKDEIKRILETIASSPTYERDVAIFWFFYEQGYTAKEISLLPAVGLTVKGVEAVLFRLARHVREKFGLKEPQ